MPKFASDGPDLPPELLQAQDDGRLILITGAGVSMPQLPNFRGLVERACQSLHEELSGLKKELLNQGQLDLLLSVLEKEYGRQLRRTVIDILEKKRDPEKSLHRELLDISSYEGKTRLVTTNFDDFFSQTDPSIKTWKAPHLPVSHQVDEWEGVVHLHGAIDKEDPHGSNLVLTSGDFGHAYMRDGWAARFLSMLMDNYIVLFIGYSVNDPIIQYLLHTQNKNLSSSKQGIIYALAGIQGPQKIRERQKADWRAKGVTPLFYSSGHGHRALRKTLLAWAKISRDGIKERERLLLQRIDVPPTSLETDEAALVQWALSEATGTVAGSFARHTPTPPIGWLIVVEAVLKRLTAPAPESTLSLVETPLNEPWLTPLPRPSLALVDWLVKHLGKDALVKWVVKRGALLHPNVRKRIRSELQKTQSLPSVHRSFWQTVSAESYSCRITRQDPWRDLTSLVDELDTDLFARNDLIQALFTIPTFSFWPATVFKAFERDLALEMESSQTNPLQRTLRIQLELAGGEQASMALNQLLEKSNPQVLLPLSHYCTALLAEGLETLSYFDEVNEDYDSSEAFRPTLGAEEAFQPSWVYLVDLNIRIFEVLDTDQTERATALCQAWLAHNFPIFRRMVLHSISAGTSVDPEIGHRLLFRNEGAALWGLSERQEVLNFLEVSALNLSRENQASLIDMIVAGPPRKLFRSNISDLEFDRLSIGMAGARLQALRRGGVSLNRARENALETYQNIPAPIETRNRLADQDDSGIKHWRSLVADDPLAALDQLRSEKGAVANEARWRIFLQFISVNTRSDLSISLAKETVDALLDQREEVLRRNLYHASDLLVFLARRDSSSTHTLELWDASLPLALDAPITEGASYSSGRAVNEPTGMLSQTLTTLIFQSEPTKDSGIPAPIKTRLNQILSASSAASVYGRIWLASHLTPLFWVDPRWTRLHLIPLFNWTTSDEAEMMWTAFFEEDTFTSRLIYAIKNQFIASYRRLSEDPSEHRAALRMLMRASIGAKKPLSPKQIRRILAKLSPGHFAQIAREIRFRYHRSEDGAGAWSEEISPWIQDYWPKKLSYRTPEVTGALVDLAVLSGDRFSEAVTLILPLLSEVPSGNVISQTIKRGNYGDTHPEATLDLLEKLVPTDPHSDWFDLSHILNQIAHAQPTLAETARFKRLSKVASTV